MEMKFIKTIKGNKILIGALVIGLMLLIVPWSGLIGGSKNAKTQDSTGSAPDFDLYAEEKRIEAALAKIEGAGEVTVILTLESGSERKLAEDKDNTKDSDADGSVQTRDTSETVTVANQAVTVIYIYPKYRGALVIASGNAPGVRLQITEAVSALTGLTTDKITVVKGKM